MRTTAKTIVLIIAKMRCCSVLLVDRQYCKNNTDRMVFEICNCDETKPIDSIVTFTVIL